MPEQKLTKEELAWLKMTEQQMIDELSTSGSTLLRDILKNKRFSEHEKEKPGILKQWVRAAIADNVSKAYTLNNSVATFAGHRVIEMPHMIERNIQVTLLSYVNNPTDLSPKYDPVGNVQVALEFGGGRKKKRKSKKKSRRSKKKRKSKKKSRRTRRK